MAETRYTLDHLWVRQETDGRLTVGISGFARERLGEVVYLGLPEIGTIMMANGEVAIIESIKVAVDLRMPISGTICAVNEAAVDTPDLLNEDPTGAGWLFRVEPHNSDDFARLLDFIKYDAMTRQD